MPGDMIACGEAETWAVWDAPDFGSGDLQRTGTVHAGLMILVLATTTDKDKQPWVYVLVGMQLGWVMNNRFKTSIVFTAAPTRDR